MAVERSAVPGAAESNSKDLHLTHPDTYQRYSEKRIQLAAEATAGEWQTVDFQWRRYNTDAESGWVQIPAEDLAPRPAQWPAPVLPAPADDGPGAAAGGVVSPTYDWDAVRTVPTDGQIQVRARFFTDDGYDPGPVADGHWPLTEGTGTIASDVIGGNNGVLSGSGARWSTERGGSIAFDGTGGQVLTNTTAVDTTSSFSVAAWIKAFDHNVEYDFLTQPATHTSAFALALGRRGKILFSRPLRDVRDEPMPTAESQGQAPLNTWMHLAGVYNADTRELSLYLDGVHQQTVAYDSAGFPSGSLTLGHTIDGLWPAKGLISDVRTYRYALTAEQVAALVPVPVADGHWPLAEGSGTVAGDTVGGNNGTLSGGATWSDERGGAVAFDGTGQIVTNAPAVDTAGAFSLSAWIKADTGTSGTHTFLIQPGTHVSGFYLEYRSAGEFVFLRPLADLVPGSVSVRGPFQAGRWTHVAGVYDAAANTMTLYLDGVAQQTVVFTGTGFASGALTMGHGFVDDQVNNWAHGSISDVRAFHYALSSAEVAVLYAFPDARPPEAPGVTDPAEVTLDRFGLADSHATTTLAPGRLSLLTGAFEVTDPDVSIGSHGGGLALSRTFVSADPASQESGLFGPGWRSIIKVPGAGADYQALTDTGPGAVTIREEGGSMLPFVQETGTMTGPATYTGVSDAASMHLKLSFDGQRTYTLTDRGGNTVTFVRRSGVGHGGPSVPAYFLPRTVTLAAADAAAAALSQVTYDEATGWPTEVDAANPAGGLCSPGSFMAGCRALVFTYQDLPAGRRCTRVSYKHQDNGSGGAAPAPILIPVAEYAYDDEHGRLTTATDTRTSLATAYTYDDGGRLETVTPPGEAPWHLQYTPDPQDPDHHARLTKVVRTHNAEHGGTSESTAVVYDLPLSGPGLPDLSAASVARWAQKDAPTDVSAVFPPGHNPAGTAPTDITPDEFSWADIVGIDVNGRAVNHAAWGGTADPDTGAEIEPDWRITTTEYDARALGNTVRTLSANNRYRALREDPDGTRGTATQLDTRRYYSADGKELLDTYGPAHLVADSHPGPPPATDLTGRWMLNEGGGRTAYDASGLGHPGTVHESVGWQHDPVRGIVATFPGSADAAVVIDEPLIEAGRDVSLTVWARLARTDRDAIVVGQVGQHNDHLRLGYSAAHNTWVWCMTDRDASEASSACAIAAAPAEAGIWTGLVATFRAATGELHLYADGRPGSTGVLTAPQPRTGNRFEIGGPGYAGAGFAGEISDARIYDRELNPGEIPLLPAAPATGQPGVWAREHAHTAYDTGTEEGHPTGGSLHLPLRTSKDAVAANLTPPTGWWRLNDGHDHTAPDTLGTNTATTSPQGVTWSTDHGGCAVLDGKTGHITTLGPAITTSGSYSVAAWVKTNTADPQNSYQTVLAQPDTATSSVFVLRYAKDTDRWQFGPPTGEHAVSPHPALTDTWTHLTGVYDTATATVALYVNGAHAGSAPAPARSESTSAMEIGRGFLDDAFTDYFHGSVADVRAYDRALTDAEIAALPDADGGIGLPAIGDRQDSTRIYTLGTDHSGWALRTPLVATFDPDGLRLATTTTYSPSGQLAAATMPAANAVEPVADSHDPRTTRSSYYGDADSTDPDTANHPAWGGLPCKVFRSGQPNVPGLPDLPTHHTTAYTVWGAPTEVTDTVTDAAGRAQHRTATTTYDPQTWRMTQVTTTATLGTALPAVTTRYDEATGQVTATSTTVDKVTRTITRAYDDFGRRTTYTDADGATTATTYDADGHVASVTDPQGTRTQTWSSQAEHRALCTRITDTGIDGAFAGAYDPDGNLTTQTYPGGLTSTALTDAAGRLMRLVYHRDGTVLLVFTRSYDGFGKVCETASRDSRQLYRYDHAGRLQTVLDTDTTSPEPKTMARTYSFDANSNRTALTTAAPGANGQASTTSASTQHTYDTADRLQPQGSDAGLAYDAFGRITLLPAADSPTAGSPGAADTVLGFYLNDLVHLQRQAGRTIANTLDPAHRPAHRTDTANPGRTQINHYPGTSDSPSWVEELDGTTTRNLTDLTGSLALTASSSGHLLLHLASPHGDTTATAAPDSDELITYTETTEYGLPRTPTTQPERYGWLGAHQRQTDTPTGLLLMGARLYNPAQGRFLQTDPRPNGTTGTYIYCDGDPVNSLDLNGQFSLGGLWHDVEHIASDVTKYAKAAAPFLDVLALATAEIPVLDAVTGAAALTVDIISAADDVHQALKKKNRSNPATYVGLALDALGFVAGHEDSASGKQLMKAEKELQNLFSATRRSPRGAQILAARRLEQEIAHLSHRHVNWKAFDVAATAAGLSWGLIQTIEGH
ncbi:hypothetical protein BIV57_00185 [Mangrovactinospora gilvigrisea]|uniref:LamG-like jellyroll fold domain-containing protein n=2 Tax=Mangrovactinospora gilvigrisea TaxID=1428644 RepID=A0A1J7BKU0_9ACTN|nr:hypothetical protein BIV57_00185 [Mangrovactinospora gilvigrisea]